jgi:hypothetical protein
MNNGSKMVSIAISMLLVSSFAFAVFGAFGADDEYKKENGALGASSALAITDSTPLTDITNAVSALINGDVLTITGSMDRGVTGGSELYLNIPEGAKVIWNAYFRDNGGIGIAGKGSFEADSGKLDVGGVWIDGGTPTATLNGDIEFWGDGFGSGACSTGSTMIINGNLTITGVGHDFYADGGDVIINGNLTTAEKPGSEGSGYIMVIEGIMTINGSVTIAGESGSEPISYIYLVGGGVMTINGSLTTPDDEGYLMIGGIWFAKDGYADVSSKEGYREYTDGTSSVFVKIPSGGSNILLLVAIAVAITAAVGIAGYFLFLRKR